MDQPEFDVLNGHAIGIIMKEMVRRAIEAIRAQRFIFEATGKVTEGKDDDYVTTADKAAQAVYVKVIQECFPGFGIVAEEDHLSIPCVHPTKEIYFSVDPLDGTKAFMRRQSHGIGTMLALREGARVIAAFVGDIMTHEIFGFRPGSDKVHRISEYGKAEQLVVDTSRPLSDQYCLLRDMPNLHSELISNLARPTTGGLCKNAEVSGGSIGISMARLWKGEVGAVVLRSAHDTPWDKWPIIGISQKMGFVFFKPKDAFSFERYEPVVSNQTVHCPHETLIIHESRVEELSAWRA